MLPGPRLYVRIVRGSIEDDFDQRSLKKYSFINLKFKHLWFGNIRFSDRSLDIPHLSRPSAIKCEVWIFYLTK